MIASGDDADLLLENWDGCTYRPQIQGLHGPNVPGIGYVTQVETIRDPTFETQDIFCRQYPGPRAYFNMIVFEERLYLMGGKSADETYNADTWYRDYTLPVSSFKKTPKRTDTYPWFHFSANEAGCHFEYRVWDQYNYKQLREWTPTVKKADMGFLNWRVGGPGNGNYRVYLRAVDASNNRDEKYYWDGNVYEWNYVSPTPWDIIAGAVCGFIALCALAYFEYRRRVRKAAMERYAMKRMRRKFKALQRDVNGKAVDWRTLYMEAKEQDDNEKVIRAKNKKERNKNIAKREKEKKKREKEKERIKKKMSKEIASAKSKKSTKTGGNEFSKSTKSSKSKSSKVGALLEDDPADEGFELWGEEEDQVDVVSPTKKKDKKDKRDKNKNNEWETTESMDVKRKDKPRDKPKDKPRDKPRKDKDTGTIAVEGSSREIKAGDLAASANTETGAKQRKVNKQFKVYEEEEEDKKDA